jgi:uncharacterized protein (TIGR02271 family)
MAAKQVVGLFSNTSDAQAAVQELHGASISDNDIRLVTNSKEGGLVSTLVDTGVPEDDANVYAEGVRRGGALVTVQTDDDALAMQAADIMDRHNVQDIDNLGRDYRSSGWSRFDPNAGDYTSDTTAAQDTSYTSDTTTTGDTAYAGDQTDRPEGSGVGTGIGTLSGAATGAAIGSVGGPVGTVIGGVAGAVAGAGVGHAGDRIGAEVAGDHGDHGSSTSDTTTSDTSGIGSVSNADYSASTRPNADTITNSGSTPVTADTMSTSTDYTAPTTSSTSSDTSYTAPATSDTTSTTTTNRDAGYVGVAKDSGEFVVPVVEEQINIAKQQVQGGGVRVTTSVSETPVNEQVTLHEEHVNVERRPVDQVVDPSRIDQLREGTFEVREMAEQAVVNKQARVVEEVVINKEANERTENIQDTVRRTDVNVEQLPTDMRPTGYSETVNTSTSSTQSAGYNTAGSTGNVADSGMNRTENAVARGADQAENAASSTAHAAGNVLDRAAGAVERGAEDVTGSDLNKSGGVGDSNV